MRGGWKDRRQEEPLVIMSWGLLCYCGDQFLNLRLLLVIQINKEEAHADARHTMPNLPPHSQLFFLKRDDDIDHDILIVRLQREDENAALTDIRARP